MAQIAKAGHSVFLVVHGDFHLSRAQSEHSSLVQPERGEKGGKGWGWVGMESMDNTMNLARQKKIYLQKEMDR